MQNGHTLIEALASKQNLDTYQLENIGPIEIDKRSSQVLIRSIPPGPNLHRHAILRSPAVDPVKRHVPLPSIPRREWPTRTRVRRHSPHSRNAPQACRYDYDARERIDSALSKD